MATILEERKDSKSNMTNRSVALQNVVISKPKTESLPSRQAIKDQPLEYEVIFAVDNSNINQKAFDFAIQTAKNFSAKLVLLYVTKSVKIPSGYMNFAKVENIEDYEWHYYNSLASSKLENLSRKAEAASISWTSRTHIGNMTSALDSYVGDKRAIVVFNPSEKNNFGKALRGLSPKQLSNQGVPVAIF
ncbi:MAG TPA: universal stress protein [Nitrososphaerales archaeon]|nr:universal stress protein [Nitrososphaerales archaeon]